MEPTTTYAIFGREVPCSSGGFDARPIAGWRPAVQRDPLRCRMHVNPYAEELGDRDLTGEQKNRSFFHPDFGELNVAWIAAQMAGHDIHHLKQFQQIR